MADNDDIDRSGKGFATDQATTPLSYAPTPLSGGTTGNVFLDSRNDLFRIAQADQNELLTDEDFATKYPDLPGFGGPELPPLDGKTIPTAEVDQSLSQLSELRKQDAGDVKRQLLPPPSVPSIPAMPETSDSIVRHAIGAFANPLMLLAATAGALTKRPALNALAAATGVMEGLNERDWQKAYLQQHKFRNSVKETAVEADRQIAAVDAILNSGADTATKLGNIDALGDPTLSRFVRQGDLDSIQKFNEGFKKATEGLHRANRGYRNAQQTFAEEKESSVVDLVGQGKMDPPPLNSAKNRAFMKRVEEKYPEYNPETDSPAAKHRAQRLELREAGVPRDFDETKPLPKNEDLAISFAEGNTSAATNLPKQTAAMVKSRGAWLAANPDVLAEAKQGRTGLTEKRKEFVGGMTASQTAGRIEGRIVSALSRAQKAAPIVMNLSERVNRSEFPDLNSILLSTEQRIGDVSIPEFRTALQTLVLNYAQAIGGGAQGAVTVDAAKHARELLDTAFTKGQVRGTVRQMLFEINRELEGAQEAMRTVAGTGQVSQPDKEQQAYEWAIQNLNNPTAQKLLKAMGL